MGGIVGVDGRMTEAVVLRSNAGPVLDAAALAAARATVFTPAQDAAGKPLSVAVNYPIDFAADDLSPTFVKRASADYPDEERLAGHLGKVVIAGRIGADGRLIDAQVKETSRAPGLDAASMKAALASEFRPYRDGAGKAVEMPVTLPFSFDSLHTAGVGGGMLRYRCDQFVRDEDWWKSAWPADSTTETYTMMLGVSMLGQNVMGDISRFKGAVADFKVRWGRAVEACRTKPDKLMIDVFKPEGDWARRLAERGK